MRVHFARKGILSRLALYLVGTLKRPNCGANITVHKKGFTEIENIQRNFRCISIKEMRVVTDKDVKDDKA